MATFWEKAAHSVDHKFSLYFDCLLFNLLRILFEGCFWVLIASVPGLCIFFTSVSLNVSECVLNISLDILVKDTGTCTL